MRKRSILIVSVMIGFYMLAGSIFAISTDGYFGDWNDKPGATDPIGDAPTPEDIITLKWFPDNTSGNLYFMVTRNGYAKKNFNWNCTFELIYNTTSYTINVSSAPNSSSVTVYMYDAAGRYVWSGKGKWCDMVNTEFYVPMNTIFNVGNSGYSIKIRVTTASDVAPDSGYITITSISTYPYVTVGAGITLVIFVMVRKRKKVKTCGHSY